MTFHTGNIVTTMMSHQEMLHQEEMTSVAAKICCQFGITTAIPTYSGESVSKQYSLYLLTRVHNVTNSHNHWVFSFCSSRFRIIKCLIGVNSIEHRYWYYNVHAYVTGYWKTDQIITLGLFHFIGPANGYTCTLHIQSAITRLGYITGLLF